jgi:hypothetical protein
LDLLWNWLNIHFVNILRIKIILLIVYFLSFYLILLKFLINWGSHCTYLAYYSFKNLHRLFILTILNNLIILNLIDINFTYSWQSFKRDLMSLILILSIKRSWTYTYILIILSILFWMSLQIVLYFWLI